MDIPHERQTKQLDKRLESVHKGRDREEGALFSMRCPQKASCEAVTFRHFNEENYLGDGRSGRENIEFQHSEMGKCLV